MNVTYAARGLPCLSNCSRSSNGSLVPLRFPEDPEGFRVNLARLLAFQNSPLAALVYSAAASLIEVGYDNWDGGQTSFQLELAVPMPVFAQVEPQLRETERLLFEKAEKLVPTGNRHLREVRLVPSTQQAEDEDAQGSSGDHLWQPSGYFRLFLSHVAAHRVRVAELKGELQLFGVAAFVAHADIEPATDWPDEIELALRTMQALVALLTADFHDSKWTDQEVGFALARRTLILPIRAGLDPYGFLGRVQGTPGRIDNPKGIALDIVDILLRHGQTSTTMVEALVTALERSPSYVATNGILDKLKTRTDLTAEQLSRLRNALGANSNVGNAYTAPIKIAQVLKAHGVVETAAGPPDDDIPF